MPLVFLLALTVGCDNGIDAVAQNQSGLPRLGELWQMAQQSTAPDRDGDYLPDDIELLVGTDPNDRDTDHDGLPDNFEIFAGGSFADDDFVPDNDNDAIVAAIDADDNNDLINDGETTDTDGDGLPNYLEYYGYTYDWMTDRFILWNGDPNIDHWFTDPLQRSTDQDAYPDGMEASGALMDVLVRRPGDHPLVPSCPNIVVQLVSYSVTLNEDITYEEGESLAKGQTWNRETTVTDSRTVEHNWEVGAEAKFTTVGWPSEVTVHAKYGGSVSNTHSTSTAVATGGSVLNETNWSKARSFNPSEAARLKLFLKVHNYGTAPLSSIVPTLTLRIGGLNVATFQPGNAQVNMLVPDGTYPSEETVCWVVDSTSSGPLYLTMQELRALEMGAPVNITMTQVLGDVMQLDQDGVWQRLGDCNEYIARCQAVSANLYIQLPEGSFVHHLVYSDDAPSAPVTTLVDALTRLGVDQDGYLSYLNRQGVPRLASFDNCHFVFDVETLLANGWSTDANGLQPPVDFDPGTVRLLPGSTVFVKQGRPAGDPGLVIHYASADPQTGEIVALASDYQGIARMWFVDKTDPDPSDWPEMFEVIPDASLFRFVTDPQYVFAQRPDPAAGESLERVVVENLRGDIESKTVTLVHYLQPKPPLIGAFVLDLTSAPPHIYANVTNPTPTIPIKWVRAFHPLLNKGSTDPNSPEGYVELENVPNVYDDADGWIAKLPSGWSWTDIRLVAHTAPGAESEEPQYTELVRFFIAPKTFEMLSTVPDPNGSGLNLDVTSSQYSKWDVNQLPTSGWEDKDIFASIDPFISDYFLSFACNPVGSGNTTNARAIRMSSTGYTFDKIDPTVIEYYLLLPAAQRYLTINLEDHTYYPPGYQQGEVVVMRTHEGRLAKIRIDDCSVVGNQALWKLLIVVYNK
ncbi:MAG: binary toxin-like calcium binding domain-containing protein [Planctomycetota bacterium]